MAKNIIITVDAKSNAVSVNSNTVGAIGENLQGLFIVEFCGADYIAGACWLEIDGDGEKGYIELKPSGNNTYTAPIKSGITKHAGNIKAQIRITQSEVDGDIPIFKSDMFNLNTIASINAIEEIPDEYPEWIDTANEKIAEMNALMADIEEKAESGYFSVKVVQETGQSTKEVMSQKAVTDALDDKVDNSALESISALEIENLFN